MYRENRHLGVSVVIPNYNGREVLARNLPSVLEAKNYSPNKIREIIVVDDCSTDGSYGFMRATFSGIRLIRHTRNRGFSASVNTGARAAKNELIALLNTDVVPSVDFLSSAIAHFEKPEVFGVSFHEKGYGWARGKFVDGFIIHEPGFETKSVHETFWVNGGSGVFKRDYWMKLNGMDEKLLSPFYWEDIDLSYRAAKRGWVNLWEPNAHVIHEHELTIGRISKRLKERIQERNQLIFIWKNLTSPILFRKHIVGLLRRVSLNPGYLNIVFASLKKIKPILKSRKREKKEAKFSDETIFAKFQNA